MRKMHGDGEKRVRASRSPHSRTPATQLVLTGLKPRHRRVDVGVRMYLRQARSLVRSVRICVGVHLQHDHARCRARRDQRPALDRLDTLRVQVQYYRIVLGAVGARHRQRAHKQPFLHDLRSRTPQASEAPYSRTPAPQVPAAPRSAAATPTFGSHARRGVARTSASESISYTVGPWHNLSRHHAGRCKRPAFDRSRGRVRHVLGAVGARHQRHAPKHPFRRDLLTPALLQHKPQRRRADVRQPHSSVHRAHLHVGFHLEHGQERPALLPFPPRLKAVPPPAPGPGGWAGRGASCTAPLPLDFSPG